MSMRLSLRASLSCGASAGQGPTDGGATKQRGDERVVLLTGDDSVLAVGAVGWSATAPAELLRTGVRNAPKQ
jgi:hypothetical protein